MTAVTSSAETAAYAGPEVWGAFIGGAFVEAGDSETFAVMGAGDRTADRARRQRRR